MAVSDRLPGWFRLGAWVTDETGPAMAVGQIRRIDLDEEEVDVAWVRYYGTPKVPTRETLPLGSALFPVRFREPTFDEGVAFLGKVMVSPNKLRNRATLLVEVSQALDDCGNLLTTFNRIPWECLQACTVEGMPFGVAVRAEEADDE